MRLRVSTPLSLVLDVDNVSYLAAEDETGKFGILPGHADFLTALEISVVTWRSGEREKHLAVRGGILSMSGGDTISIVTREALGEETLAALGDAVLKRMREEHASEEAANITGTRLELAALRQIERYLATGRSQTWSAQSSEPSAMPDVGQPTGDLR